MKDKVENLLTERKKEGKKERNNQRAGDIFRGLSCPFPIWNPSGLGQ
jgi:hypothetical protein